jgi:hypothetical protein
MLATLEVAIEVVIPPSVLSIALDGNDVLLTWPNTTSSAFNLEGTLSLTPRNGLLLMYSSTMTAEISGCDSGIPDLRSFSGCIGCKLFGRTETCSTRGFHFGPWE